MFEQYQDIDLFPTSVFDFVINMLVAFVCGLVISIVYRFIYKGPNYSMTYVNALVLLTMITSLVILVIGNNLARAFGLVGAMSIIRFRTAVRDVQDIVFIFFALTIGMAAGVGLHAVAVAGTIIVSLVAIILFTFNFGQASKIENLLFVSYSPLEDIDKKLDLVIKKYCRRIKLVNIKKITNDELAAYYHVVLKRARESKTLIDEINKMEGITNVNLYFDEDDTSSL
ncbi:MAG: DUF4956 domain-containing protein [Bacteroidales bacterium]|nr:DUF4956 domain-containing protein [Bacteroidales bacterium]